METKMVGKLPIQDFITDMVLGTVLEALDGIFDLPAFMDLDAETDATTLSGVLSDVLQPVLSMIDVKLSNFAFPTDLADTIISGIGDIDTEKIMEQYVNPQPKGRSDDNWWAPDVDFLGRSVPDDDMPLALHISWEIPHGPFAEVYDKPPICAAITQRPTLDFIITLIPPIAVDVYISFNIPFKSTAIVCYKHPVGLFSFGLVTGNRDFSGIFVYGGPISYSPPMSRNVFDINDPDGSIANGLNSGTISDKLISLFADDDDQYVLTTADKIKKVGNPFFDWTIEIDGDVEFYIDQRDDILEVNVRRSVFELSPEVAQPGMSFYKLVYTSE